MFNTPNKYTEIVLCVCICMYLTWWIFGLLSCLTLVWKTEKWVAY